jgi:hypothetical protein
MKGRLRGELSEELALCAPVALAKRTERVDIGEILRGRPRELALRQTLQMVDAREPSENVGGTRFELTCHREPNRPFRDIDLAQITRPFIDVLKDCAMNSL